MKCPNCGAEVTSKFCPYCGSEMPHKEPPVENWTDDHSTHTTIINNYYGSDNRTYNIPKEPVSQKSRLVAGLLCLFLGFLGAHQFYAGRKGMGFLYLFTAGLFYIGWAVDLVKIVIGSFTDANGYKLK